ncbi:CE1759 family FMN reductase [Corynebacterium mayonis]|uniref:CE1759 family FMN reductase n=1 Tax=Corynebacterium mayonis TaxID=3062461 RepID=UPI0031401EFB
MAQLVVLSAGLSTPSATRQVADSIATAAQSLAADREQVKVTTVEIRDYSPELIQASTTGVVPQRLADVFRELSLADGLIAATPVFKASYTGLFKLFFDLLDTEALNGMPTVLVATAGTARHSLITEYAMRPLFTFMRAVVVPTSVFAATEDFGGAEGREMQERINRAASELVGLMIANPGLGSGSAARPRRNGVDPEEDFVPFRNLLHGDAES